jgi:hypothetical protein
VELEDALEEAMDALGEARQPECEHDPHQRDRDQRDGMACAKFAAELAAQQCRERISQNAMLKPISRITGPSRSRRPRRPMLPIGTMPPVIVFPQVVEGRRIFDALTSDAVCQEETSNDPPSAPRGRSYERPLRYVTKKSAGDLRVFGT